MKFFGKKKQPPPPPPGVADYWATVHVVLAEALPVHDRPEDEPASFPDLVVGYYRNFGLRCALSRIRAVLSQAVEDGMIDWQDSEVSEALPFCKLDRDIRRRVVPVTEEGIWYASGKALYGPEGNEEQEGN